MNEYRTGVTVIYQGRKYRISRYRLRGSQCGLIDKQTGQEHYPLSTAFVTSLPIARRKRATNHNVPQLRPE